MDFKLKSPFKPTGDQPQAIESLTRGLSTNQKHQVLLGVTGSGKTFSIANVIKNTQLPTLVISHNKTLAAQLYQEFRDFFPQNAVSYFVSYYDYYQPEAYIPQTDTYIEKEVDINEEIERLRLQATTHLLTRSDVIVVASVSCIYNIGSPIEWNNFMFTLKVGSSEDRRHILQKLVELQYDRSDLELKRGTFRLKGDTLQIWPAYENAAVNIHFIDNTIEAIQPINPTTGQKTTEPILNLSPNSLSLYPAKHYMTDPTTYKSAFTSIKSELKDQVAKLKKQNRPLEAHRLNQKVNFDLEMISEVGYVNGIENYSRHFDDREPGQPPYTLFDYFYKNNDKFLLIIDESHMTIPQINGMYRGDRSRKQTLIDFGFRLPSALDNRPLKFDEFQRRQPQTIYTSATPGGWEVSMAQSQKLKSKNKKTHALSFKHSAVIEQLIRPTGLVDPTIDIRKTENQISDLIKEIETRVINKQRVLVTTLTKRTAEALAKYLEEKRIKVHYLHSDIDTLDRTDILDQLRKGKYDVVVGINLLREGLDLPEVSLVAILDADKEGFLRSHTSLIQTMGRAARHVDGRVIMYADSITRSMRLAIKEVDRRRKIQLAYNKKHRLTPKSIQKPIRDQLIKRQPKNTPAPTVIQLSRKEAVDLKTLDPDSLTPQDKKRLIRSLNRKMLSEAKLLNFELAAKIRDKIQDLKA